MPADASVVVVAGPKTDLLPGEIDALQTYLAKGGKLMLLLDPPETADDPPLTNLMALAHEWGIDLGNNVVVDVSGMGRLLGTDASVPVAVNYPSHPIVQDMDLLTAYPLARSVSVVTGGVDGHIAQAFVETSAQSWAESDLKTVVAGGKVGLDEAKGDKRGPVAIAAAVSAPVATAAAQPPGAEKPGEDAAKPESRVVVFGDSDFASTAALGISGNRDLFMNAVSWLAQQENLIAIRPKEADDRRITMTANQQLRVRDPGAVGRPGAGVRQRRLRVVAEAVDARIQVADRPVGGAGRPRGVRLLRRVEEAARRGAATAGPKVVHR